MGGVHMSRAGDIQQSTFNVDEFDLNDSDREDFDNLVDILFVLDQSGSMGTYIEQSKKTICKIVEKFKKKEYDLKFSLCTYIDHPPQDNNLLTDFTDLCSGKQLVEKLMKVYSNGGGDEPEAVMDGLRDGITKTSWRKAEVGKDDHSQRFLFHICDAPPHGEEYGSQSSDPEWTKNGCPCGTKKEDIKELLEKHQIQYFLIKPCENISKMETLFKECFGKQYIDTISLLDKVQKEETLDGENFIKETKPEMWEGVLTNLEKNMI